MYTRTISPIQLIVQPAMFPSTPLDDFCVWRNWFVTPLSTPQQYACASAVSRRANLSTHTLNDFSRPATAAASRSSKPMKSSHFNFEDYGDDFDDESTLS